MSMAWSTISSKVITAPYVVATLYHIIGEALCVPAGHYVHYPARKWKG